jgi:hypothetical protein
MSESMAELALHRAQTEVDRPLTVAEIRAHVNLIQDVMRSVMIEGIHYGKIPGMSKPTLYKPGAEKILVTFRIATEPIVEDLSTPDAIRYRAKLVATSQTSGLCLGSSVGECSSDEEKYRWRAAICDGEFDDTLPDSRRVVWKRQWGGSPEKVRQVRTNPADIANTILKMAVKRGKIAVTLDVTAASDIFAQGVEDLPAELQREIAAEEGGAPALSDPKPSAPPDPDRPGIYVRGVRVLKTGSNDKGPWKLYAVRLSDGIEYTTLAETLAKVAMRAASEGVPVTFQSGEYKGKKTLTSISIAEVAP